MRVAVFGTAVRPGAIVDPMINITDKDASTLAGDYQVVSYSKCNDPASAFVGGTLFNSPYFDPKSGVYLQGATQGSAGQALLGFWMFRQGSINPHSCYKNDCLDTSQNWTAQKALDYSLQHESMGAQPESTVPGNRPSIPGGNP